MDTNRRTLLAAGAAAAAMTAMPRAFAQWQPSQRYPDPSIKIIDPSFAQYRIALAKVEQHRHGHALGRRAGVVRRRPLPPVERHPEQPHHALGRGDRRGQRVPQAVQQRQRQHARPAGPAPHLRARHPARDAHRVRRHHHRDRRPLRRQAAQLAERHRVQVRRLDLVHRPAVRHPRQLRRPRRQARAADQRLPRRRPDRHARGGGRRRNRPNGLASRPTSRSSTSSRPARRRA